MKTIRLVVKTQSPLVIAARHVALGGSTPSQDHIPGSTLRGALAGALLRLGWTGQSSDFQALFERDAVRYGNLYPTTNAGEVSWPIPLTARSCKRYPGFRPNKQPDKHSNHGVVDSLRAQLSEAAWQPNYCCGERPWDRPTGKACDAELDEFGGYYVRTEDGVLLKPEHGRRLITRTAIDGRFGSARQGALYTVEAVEEGEHFIGYLHVMDDVASLLCDALDRIGATHTLRMGMGRSRGFGQVDLSYDVYPAAESTPHLGVEVPFARRWRTPDLTKELRHWAEEERFPFVLTLYANAILPDDYGRYQTALTQGAWQRIVRYAGAPPSSMSRWPTSVRVEEWRATSVEAVHTWRFAPGWRKPAADELAVRRGSVFLLSARHEEEEEVALLLQRLEETGMGQRRSEGFGQFMVGHPWHTEMERKDGANAAESHAA